jgi:acetyltransferase-like isoleucine patch superfamily enzyme
MAIGWNEEIKKELGSCGKNVFIGHNVMITQPQNVHLGDNVRIDPFTLITSKLITGNNVQITAHVTIGGSYNTVKLGNWTFIGYGSQLFTNSEDYSGECGPVNEFWGNGRVYKGDIEFKDYSGIASQVIVFPGVTLQEGCCIGAQSLVPRKNDLMGWNVYVGNPLRQLKIRNKVNVLKYANDPNFLKDKWK